jgi:hypothetical protein
LIERLKFEYRRNAARQQQQQQRRNNDMTRRSGTGAAYRIGRGRTWGSGRWGSS